MTLHTVPSYDDPLRWVAYIMGMRHGWEWHRWQYTGDSDTGRQPDSDRSWFRAEAYAHGFRHGYQARHRFQTGHDIPQPGIPPDQS